MKISKFLFVGLLFVLVVAGCGGNGGGAPVAMSKYESDTVSIEYPKAWQDSSMDMFGMTIGIYSPIEMGEEALMAMDDPFQLLESDPLAMFLVVPAEMASDLNIDEFDDEIVPEGDEDIDIVKQGDINIDGAKGKEVIAKGTPEDLGVKIGIHLVAAKKDDGSAVVFIGMTPDKDLDKNLDIFEYMVKSIKLK